MSYTVHQLAQLAGISVRTLHYYDQIGLLEPTGIEENGYRYYESAELAKLQQILFFKELDFTLEEIKQIINAPNFDRLAALEEQKKLLELEQKRLTGVIKTIDKTIQTLKGGETMNDDDLYGDLDKKTVEEYKAEAKQRWGHTDAYRQSQERVSKMTKAQMQEIKKAGDELTKELAAAMDLPVDSPEVQALIKRHHAGIEVFYDCSMEMYRGLGQMYVDDPRFTATYDKYRPGLAIFLRDAILIYTDQKDQS